MSARRCSIDGCATRVLARGWCSKHYDRWRRQGDPLAARERRPEGLSADEVLRWFGWDDEDGCWINRVRGKANPYGYIGFEGKRMPASRLAYLTWRGPIPDGYVVCHTCDRPRCVNPAHLFLGTHDDNMADMVAKGRQTLGERNPMAKLTEDDVRTIRAALARGESRRAIVENYGYTHSTVAHVARGDRWTHVPDLPLPSKDSSS